MLNAIPGKDHLTWSAVAKD